MSGIIANQILPSHLVEEIQKYIEGTHLYIPQKSRKIWGSESGIRNHLEKRNMEIHFLYRQHGLGIEQIAQNSD